MSIFGDAWNILENVADAVTYPMRYLDQQLFGPPEPVTQLPILDANPEEILKKGLKMKIIIMGGIVLFAWYLVRKK